MTTSKEDNKQKFSRTIISFHAFFKEAEGYGCYGRVHNCQAGYIGQPGYITDNGGEKNNFKKNRETEQNVSEVRTQTYKLSVVIATKAHGHLGARFWTVPQLFFQICIASR